MPDQLPDRFRRKAVAALRLSERVVELDRKLALLNLAQAWLSLANHADQVRELEAKTETLVGVCPKAADDYD